MARFRGEVTAQDERDYKPTGADVTKGIAAGLMSVVASYTGIKIVADLPEWLTQKYFTSQERSRIKAALKAKETELDRAGAGDALEAKKLHLEESINASKFLTKEKKVQLIKELKDVIETRNAGVLLARDKRDQEIAKLLDQAIQSRIKNTQVLKETLNSALMVTGLAAMRGAAYGAVALWERRARLMQDERFKAGKIARGLDPQPNFINDLIIGGMQDTWKQLKGGGAETKAGKAVNFVQGLTIVMRAAGFAELAISEILQEGGPSSMIEASLKAWEEKGAGQAALDNIKAPWERIGSLFGRASEAVGGAPETAPGSGTDSGDTGTDTSGAGADSGADNTSPAQSNPDGSPSPEAGAGAPTSETVEYTESDIETGTVHKDDGIIEILQRQGMSAKAALAAAREAGIVRPGGDTRLATESIGRISILAYETDGHQVIVFHDTQTGNDLSLDQARAQGFTYEHGSGAPAVSETAVADHDAGASLEPAPDVEGSAEIPHTFVDGKITLNPIEGGFNVDTNPSSLSIDQVHGMGDLDAIGTAATAEIPAQQEIVNTLSQRIASELTILEKLDKQGLGNNPEAQYVKMLLRNDLFLANSRPGTFKVGELLYMKQQSDAYDVDKLIAVAEADRINDVRIPGLGKVEFDYDANGNPSFNLVQFLNNPHPVLGLRAQNLLVDNWQESVAANYVLNQELQIAGPVYLMNEALKELKAAGHENSAESKFLTQQLGEYLRARADVLDGNNPIVKEAATAAGIYTEVFASNP